MQDGSVQIQTGVPSSPENDGIDVMAYRKHSDGLPGFLPVMAQVATGKNWKEKSIRNHLVDVFPYRWSSPPPCSPMIPCHVIPFARPGDMFGDEVRELGNVLHRLRLPKRVHEAVELHRRGEKTEAFDLLEGACQSLATYRNRVKQDCGIASTSSTSGHYPMHSSTSTLQ